MEKKRSGKSFRKRTAQFELNSLLVNQNILKFKNNVSLVVSSSKSEPQNQGKKREPITGFCFYILLLLYKKRFNFGLSFLYRKMVICCDPPIRFLK